MRMLYSVIVLVGIIILSGCGGKDSETSLVERERTPQDIVVGLESTFVSSGIETALRDGVRELHSLTSAIPREIVFNWMLDKAISEEGWGALQATYMQVAEEDLGLAERYFAKVNFHLNADAPYGWSEAVINSDLPAHLRAQGWRQFVTYVAAENPDPYSVFDEKLDVLFGSDFMGFAPSVINQMLQHGIQQEQYDRVASFIERLRTHYSDYDGITRLILATEGTLLLKKGRLSDAFSHYQRFANDIGDGSLSLGVTQLLSADGEHDGERLRDEIVSWAYSQYETFPRTAEEVALWQLNRLGDAPPVDDLIAVVHKAITAGLPMGNLANAFILAYAYPAMETGTDADREALFALIGQILEQIPDANERLRARLINGQLDVCFYREDYGTALKIVEAGVPGFDEVWHAELANKIQAHKALQDGNLVLAIELFQQHIDYVEGWSSGLASPDTGDIVSKEEVIAHNHRRIGDLYRQMVKPIEATAAYQAAVGSYENALQMSNLNSSRRRDLQDAINQLQGLIRELESAIDAPAYP